MFKDEIEKKFNITRESFSFSLTMMGRDRLIVSGVKGVVFASNECVKLRLKSEILTLVGEALQLKEIGGGDVYVKGGVTSVNFE